MAKFRTETYVTTRYNTFQAKSDTSSGSAVASGHMFSAKVVSGSETKSLKGVNRRLKGTPSKSETGFLNKEK